MTSPKYLAITCWLLRLVLALQCLGVAVNLLLGPFETEADLYGLLFFDLNWPEEISLAVEDAGNWASLLAGMLVVLVPVLSKLARREGGRLMSFGLWLQIVCLVWIASWQALLSSLHAWRGGGFMSEWAIGAHAVRIFSPLALILLLMTATLKARNPKVIVCQWILRLATAATFAVHGLEAIFLNSRFVDLLIGSGDQLLGIAVSESTTTPILYVIGAVDLVVALLIVVVRSKPLAAYMAFWGFLTASSRMTAAGLAGLTLTYPETLIRLANGGAPLALLLLWIGLERERIESESNEPNAPIAEDTTHHHESEHEE